MTRRYIVNTALAAPMWTPEAYQYVRFRNPHYLNSLWLGTVWNLMLLPLRVWHEVICVLLSGHFLAALVIGVWFLPKTVLEFFVNGIMGRARGVPLDPDMMRQSRFLTEEEAAACIRAGADSFVSSV